MIKVSNKFMYFFLILITLFILIILNLLILKNTLLNNNLYIIKQKESIFKAKIESQIKSKIEKEIISPSNSLWEIEFISYNLKASIKEGVSNDVLKNYVGHFENTSKIYGNICLASHNRGSITGDYFGILENLKIGDIIIYRVEGMELYYKVTSKQEIEETQIEYLDDTKEEKLTLITCVKNKPTLRLCVQANLAYTSKM